MLAERLEQFKAKFVGINPKFLESISDNSWVSERYARLIDYIQYNNPPFNQHRMEEELGIPQPSISRTLKKVRVEGDTRIRQDINLNKVALKTLFVFYEGILLPVVPAVDWIASGWWTSSGTLLIYRVPPEYKDKLVNMIADKIGQPTEVVGVKSTFIAKPSVEYYFIGNSELDPVKAIGMLEKHPHVPKRVVGFTDDEITLEFKDPRALELLQYLEHDVIEARKVYSKKWGLKMYNIMANRVSRILRGARAMFLDKENVMIFARLDSSRKCSEHVAEILAVYPYVTNIILTDENNLMLVFSMPFKYWGSVMKWLLELCGPGTVRFRAYISVLSGSIIRQYLPWMNFNNERGYWGFDEAVKLTLVRLVRGAKSPEEAFKLYELDVDDYVRELVETMGADYAINLLPQLPLDVRNKVENALNNLLGGGQSGGASSGNP